MRDVMAIAVIGLTGVTTPVMVAGLALALADAGRTIVKALKAEKAGPVVTVADIEQLKEYIANAQRQLNSLMGTREAASDAALHKKCNEMHTMLGEIRKKLDSAKPDELHGAEYNKYAQSIDTNAKKLDELAQRAR